MITAMCEGDYGVLGVGSCSVEEDGEEGGGAGGGKVRERVNYSETDKLE